MKYGIHAQLRAFTSILWKEWIGRSEHFEPSSIFGGSWGNIENWLYKTTSQFIYLFFQELKT